jgi:23S rRNA (pseudouridine1915-N3)-methyltransferase
MSLRPNHDGVRSSAIGMARIVVHTHGKAREKGYSHLIQKYAERLEGRGVTLIPHSDRLSHDAYTSKIEDAASNGVLILLDENGKCGSTEWMLANWQQWKLSSKATHLAIGPVDGFSDTFITKHSTISLGPLTMTYEMAAVVLLEQLYRASEIERGSSYHRE